MFTVLVVTRVLGLQLLLSIINIIYIYLLEKHLKQFHVMFRPHFPRCISFTNTSIIMEPVEAEGH